LYYLLFLKIEELFIYHVYSFCVIHKHEFIKKIHVYNNVLTATYIFEG